MYTMEYYSAIKRNEFVTTLMNLEGILLSEISQGRTNIIWFHSHVETSHSCGISHMSETKQNKTKNKAK